MHIYVLKLHKYMVICKIYVLLCNLLSIMYVLSTMRRTMKMLPT